MIGFRVDANAVIATGHLMRCIAIACACRRMGAECLFIMAQEQGTEQLDAQGIPYQILHTKWDDLHSEKELLEAVIRDHHVDYMVVDSYQADPDYLRWLNGIVPTMYIDDLQQHIYDVNAVLHYACWSDETSYEAGYSRRHTHLLKGMQYVPLREEFLGGTERARERKILITTGGTDPYDMAYHIVLACMQQDELKTYEYDVILGGMYSDASKALLRQLAGRYPGVRLHENVSNISAYMRSCQMAVSAGGSTLFELCACKTPTVCFSFVDNQLAQISGMHRHEIMLYAGDARQDSALERVVCEQLLMLADNEELRQQYALRMGKLVDGRGCDRIAQYLMSGR